MSLVKDASIEKVNNHFERIFGEPISDNLIKLGLDSVYDSKVFEKYIQNGNDLEQKIVSAFVMDNQLTKMALDYLESINHERGNK